MQKLIDMKTIKKPEWASEDSGPEFAGRIIAGVTKSNEKSARKSAASVKKKLQLSDYVSGIVQGDRTLLSRAITLIESNSPKHFEDAQNLLAKVLPNTGKSLRIGITGSPGVGKSTFIESLGTYLCERGHKTAVLAIDPSSIKSHGSILGDKTRMENLSRHENAFIRPSPSRGTLGGVARKTRETILLCEAAGFDIILIETVGVGQSEITVRSMVDFFLLLILPGSGDELQGIKKGIVELADLIVINKADGDNINKAKLSQQYYKQALHYLPLGAEELPTEVLTCSAAENHGIVDIWNHIISITDSLKVNNTFENKRKSQVLEWMHSMIDESLKNRFYGDKQTVSAIKEIETSVLNEKITPTLGAHLLLEKFFKK